MIFLILAGALQSLVASAAEPLWIERTEFCARPSKYLCDPKLNPSGQEYLKAENDFMSKWGFKYPSSQEGKAQLERLGYPNDSIVYQLPTPVRIAYQTWINRQIMDRVFAPEIRRPILAALEKYRARLISIAELRKEPKKFGIYISKEARELEVVIEKLRTVRVSFDPVDRPDLGEGAAIIFGTSAYNPHANVIYLSAQASLVNVMPKSMNFIIAHELSHIFFHWDSRGDRTPRAFHAEREALFRKLGEPSLRNYYGVEVMADWLAAAITREDRVVSNGFGSHSNNYYDADRVDVAEIAARPGVRDLSSWLCSVSSEDYFGLVSEAGHLSRARRLDMFLTRDSALFGCAKSWLTRGL